MKRVGKIKDEFEGSGREIGKSRLGSDIGQEWMDK